MNHKFLECNFRHLKSNIGACRDLIQTKCLIEYHLNYRNNVWDSRFRDEENTLNPRRVSSQIREIIVIKCEIIRYDTGHCENKCEVYLIHLLIMVNLQPK